MWKKVLRCNYNNRWVERYIKLIEFYSHNNKGKTEKHHILPSSIFPEYGNLREHSWNLSVIDLNVHYIAHYMLAKMIGGKMWFAFNMMKRTIPESNKKSSLYALSRIYISEEISKSNKGRKPSLLQLDRISKACLNTFVCENKDGHRIRLSKEDSRFISGEYWSYRVGYIHTDNTKIKMSKNGIKDKKVYSKDNNLKYFSENEDIPEGYTKGNELLSGVKKEYGLLWFSNKKEKISKRFEVCPDGWVEGRLYNHSGFSNINDKNMIACVDIITLEDVYIDSNEYCKNLYLKRNNCKKYKYSVFMFNDLFFDSVSSVDKYMFSNNMLELKTSSSRDYFNTPNKIINKRNTSKPTKQSIFLRNYIGLEMKDVFKIVDIRLNKENMLYNIILHK